MIRLLAGDCRDVLATLPAESVQCVVTSPPYYGLRDYGTALWDGGDAGCDHSMAICSRDPVPPSCRQCQKCGRLSRTKWLTASSVRSECDQCGITTDYTDVASRGAWQSVKRGADGDWTINTHRLPADLCSCGAVRVDRQIGLEATPDAYLATMVAVFREVRRVLRRDGVCFVNMGDSYASSTGSAGASMQSTLATKPTAAKTTVLREQGSWSRNSGGAKPKDLLLMPARLALALQADGWWVRSAIVWAKPNPMPESVTDRPTSAYEMVYLLTRSSRYYYDADAVREPLQDSTVERGYTAAKLVNGGTPKEHGNADRMVRQGKGWWDNAYVPAARNLRNVWTLSTESFSGAHFATFPSALAERCIKAGTSERGCCAACGKPWVRVVDQRAWPAHLANNPQGHGGSGRSNLGGSVQQEWLNEHPRQTTGWSPGCDHDAPTVPCTVLDPFAGAGTTLLVADRLQRDAIGIELNTAYTEMAMERCRQDAPLFTDLGPMPEHPEESAMADLFDMAAD